MYDITRIDHFRAFAGFWAVGADKDTAMVGDWRKGPGRPLFDRVAARLGAAAPVIMAEDLGVITPDVTALRRAIDAPGMVVLQFAWGGGYDNTHLPHNHYANSFVYPGTHDNETTVGWWQDSATVRRARGRHSCDVMCTCMCAEHRLVPPTLGLFGPEAASSVSGRAHRNLRQALDRLCPRHPCTHSSRAQTRGSCLVNGKHKRLLWAAAPPTRSQSWSRLLLAHCALRQSVALFACSNAWDPGGRSTADS